MPYAVIIVDQKGASRNVWVACRGIRCGVEPKRRMYYPHPSAARTACDAFDRKLRRSVRFFARPKFYIVPWTDFDAHWAATLGGKPPVYHRYTPQED